MVLGAVLEVAGPITCETDVAYSSQSSLDVRAADLMSETGTEENR